jgi:chemotaxis protein MotA
MNIPIGWFIAIVASIGGFHLVVGDISKLWVPKEFAIIFGGGLGALIAANKWRNLKNIGSAIARAFTKQGTTATENSELLSLMFELLVRIKKGERNQVDADLSAPFTSPAFTKYPSVLKRPRLVEFVTDYFKMAIDGNATSIQLDTVMSQEIDVLDRESREPAESLEILADSMPAFGIVAAITGVIAALNSLAGPDARPATVGADVASALVGTLLGVFIAYAILAPVARTLYQLAEAELRPYRAVKEVLCASFSGFAPPVAVEYGRKVLFSDQRPTMEELGNTVNPSSGKRLRG